jgi:hypothetical protein
MRTQTRAQTRAETGGNKPAGNILIHCCGGMHRTGMLFAIIRRWVNDDPIDDVLADYRRHSVGTKDNSFEHCMLWSHTHDLAISGPWHFRIAAPAASRSRLGAVWSCLSHSSCGKSLTVIICPLAKRAAYFIAGAV